MDGAPIEVDVCGHACGVCHRVLVDPRHPVLDRLAVGDRAIPKEEREATVIVLHGDRHYHKACWDEEQDAKREVRTEFFRRVADSAPQQLNGEQVREITSSRWAHRLFEAYGGAIEELQVAGPLESEAYAMVLSGTAEALKVDPALVDPVPFATPVCLYDLQTSDVGRRVYRDYYGVLSQANMLTKYLKTAHWDAEARIHLKSVRAFRAYLWHQQDGAIRLLIVPYFSSGEVAALREEASALEMSMLSDSGFVRARALRGAAQHLCDALASHLAAQVRTRLTQEALREGTVDTAGEVKMFHAARIGKTARPHTYSRVVNRRGDGRTIVECNCVTLPLRNPEAWVAHGGVPSRPILAEVTELQGGKHDPHRTVPLRVTAGDRQQHGSRDGVAARDRAYQFVKPGRVVSAEVLYVE